jgi:phosphoribosylformylglycinamidine cyclo-ligase
VEAVEGMDAGKLVLSPTRTYAPVIKQILSELRPQIHAIIHNSGGAQTKILNFIKDLHIVKDNLFPVPPLFQMIQEESKTDWHEMYKVFNMGHRMELYLDQKYASEVIDISRSFGIDARVVGFVEKGPGKTLSLQVPSGNYNYRL